MKTFLKIFTLIIFPIFILSCSTKNLFYGVGAEDTEGPSIGLTYPVTSGNISVAVLSGTFNLIGTSADKGGNDVLKIEVRTYNTGTSSWNDWQLANGTTNWSYTLDSLSDWGVVSGNRNIEIRATDTNYKANRTTVAYTMQIDNTNPALIGSISDELDTLDYDGAAAADGYHNATEGSTVAYYWDWAAGVAGYELILYNVADGTSDIFVKDVPASGTSTTFSGIVEINPGGGSAGIITTLVTLPADSYERTGADRMYFRFQGQDGKKYYLAVKPYDSNSQRAAAKLGVEETVDTVVPPTLAVFQVNGQGDSSTHDSLQVTFSWTGVADAETSIRYYLLDINNDAAAGACVGDAGVDIVVSGASNNYSYTYALDGTYTAKIKAVDSAGNCSAAWYSVSTFVVNDNVPADIAGLAISTDTGISNASYECAAADGYQCGGEGVTVAYSWTNVAAHASYGLKLTRLNDGAIDEFTFAKPGAVWTNVGGGTGPNTATTTVQARLNGGNIEFHFDGDDGMKYQIQVIGYSTTSVPSALWVASADIFIDTTAPNVVASVMDPGAYYTAVNIPFSWPATTDPDPGVTEEPSGIDYYQATSSDDGVTYSTPAVNIGLVTSITTNGYNSGTDERYNNGDDAYYRVRAVDKAGNIQTTYQPSNGIVIDSDPPNTPTNLQVAGSTGTVYFTATGNRAITWTNIADVGPSGVSYYEIGVNSTITTHVNGNNYNFTAEGTYDVKVRAVDNAGNAGAWSTAVTVIVDGTDPDESGASVTDPGAFTNLTTITFSWSGFVDTGTGIQKYQIQCSKDGAIWGAIVDISSLGADDLDTTISITGCGGQNFAVGDSSVEVRIYAVDYAGRVSALAANTESNGIAIEQSNPNDPTFAAPVADLNTNVAGNVLFTINAASDVGPSGVKEIQYMVVTNFAPGPIQTMAAAGGNIDLSGTAVDGDSYKVFARVEDNAGNFSNWVASNTIVYDISTTVPTNLSLADGAAGGEATISWNAITDGRGVDYYELLITRVSNGSTATIRIYTVGALEHLESTIGAGQVEITDAAADPTDVLDDALEITNFNDVTNGDSNPEFQITIDVEATAVGEQFNVQVKAVDDLGNDSGYSAATANIVIN